MDKKLGPLKTWQWLAIGLAAGIAYYIYRQRQATSAANVGTPAAAQPSTDLGPVDPTTGQPYALEGAYNQGAQSTTPNQNTGPTSLSQELSDLSSIEGLLSGLQQVTPNGLIAPSDQTQTGPTPINITLGYAQPTASKAVTKVRQTVKKAANKATQATHTTAKHAKAVTAAPKHNPGHTVTTHPGGKQTASSSAPHSSQQHINVAPPSHQRANPTRHPSKPKR